MFLEKCTYLFFPLKMSECYGLILRTPATTFFFLMGLGKYFYLGALSREIPKFKLAFIQGLLVVLEGLVICEVFCDLVASSWCLGARDEPRGTSCATCCDLTSPSFYYAHYFCGHNSEVIYENQVLSSLSG